MRLNKLLNTISFWERESLSYPEERTLRTASPVLKCCSQMPTCPVILHGFSIMNGSCPQIVFYCQEPPCSELNDAP